MLVDWGMLSGSSVVYPKFAASFLSLPLLRHPTTTSALLNIQEPCGGLSDLAGMDIPICGALMGRVSFSPETKENLDSLVKLKDYFIKRTPESCVQKAMAWHGLAV